MLHPTSRVAVMNDRTRSSARKKMIANQQLCYSSFNKYIFTVTSTQMLETQLTTRVVRAGGQQASDERFTFFRIAGHHDDRHCKCSHQFTLTSAKSLPVTTAIVSNNKDRIDN